MGTIAKARLGLIVTTQTVPIAVTVHKELPIQHLPWLSPISAFTRPLCSARPSLKRHVGPKKSMRKFLVENPRVPNRKTFDLTCGLKDQIPKDKNRQRIALTVSPASALVPIGGHLSTSQTARPH